VQGKRSARKKEAQSQGQTMCAFDLLATVAGKLLDEGEGSLGNMSAGAQALAACTNGVRVKQERCFEEVKHFKAEVTDQDSCNESAILPHIAVQRPVSHCRNEDIKAKFEAQDKESSMISCTKAELGCNFGAIADRWSPESVESGAFTGDAVAAAGFQKITPGMYNLLNPMDVDVKPPPLVSSDSTGEMPLYGDKVRRSISFPRGSKGAPVYAVDRDDDDDKSSGCTHPSTTTNRGFRPNCTAEHSRVKKLLACKYRKVASGRMHRGDHSYSGEHLEFQSTIFFFCSIRLMAFMFKLDVSDLNSLILSDVERKPSFRNKKMHYTRQRTQRSTFKRRKMFDRHSVIASDEFERVNGKGNTKGTARDSHAASFEGLFYLHSGIASSCYLLLC
jgi:hypothetical protein